MGQNIQQLFRWYLLFMWLIFCLLAIVEGLRARAERWKISEEKLCRCPDCHLAFIVSRTQWFAKCPRCQKSCRVPEKFRN